MLADVHPRYGAMKRVYALDIELKSDPEQMVLTQALTLNASKPHMGLSGRYGLFGSIEWWSSIENRLMPLGYVSGVIVRAYRAGQDGSGANNTVDLMTEDGSIELVGIYVNNPRDARLFRPGFATQIVYALDELKPQAAKNNLGIPYSEVALEMAVTLEPANLAGHVRVPPTADIRRVRS